MLFRLEILWYLMSLFMDDLLRVLVEFALCLAHIKEWVLLAIDVKSIYITWEATVSVELIP